MPDLKRNNGPDSSVSYHLHSGEQMLDYESRVKAIFKDQGETRIDSRKLNEMRKIFLKQGPITQAKGSAYIELGETKVTVAVFDPREIPKQNKYCVQGELYCDFKFSPFACVKRKPPMPDVEEKSLASALKRALMPAVCRQEFPNFQVDVFVNVLEDDGSALAAAITAAGLALADAGIPMYDVVTAVNCGIVDGKLLLDPCRSEEELCMSSVCGSGDHGLITMARLSNHEQISELWNSGAISPTIMKKSLEVLAQSNKDTVPIVEDVLIKRVKKCLKASEKV